MRSAAIWGNLETMNDPSEGQKPSGGTRQLQEIFAEEAGALNLEDTMETAGERMRLLETDAWPVVEGCKLVGMVRQANPDLRTAGAGHDPKTIKVGEAMSREAVYCFEDQTSGEALDLMMEHGLRILPVVDRELRIVGIVRRDELERGHAGWAGGG